MKNLNKVDLLNAFLPDYEKLVPATARIEHIDEFGSKISFGELYYKRRLSPAWGDVMKIKKCNLDIITNVIFGSNELMEKMAVDIIESELAATRSAAESAMSKKDDENDDRRERRIFSRAEDGGEMG